MTTKIEIRPASFDDLDYLVAINCKWQRSLLGDKLENGFLSAAFHKETFKILIEKSEIIVAASGQEIIGYYLVNNYSTDGILNIHREIVEKLIEERIIPGNSKIGVGVQVLVDLDYQGSNLRMMMRDALIKLLDKKYDYLFSTVSKDNKKSINAHLKDGWQFVYDTPTVHSIILKIP